MTWHAKAVLIVLAGVATYFLLGLALMLKARWLPRRCPRCRWRALKDVGGARATRVDDQGRRYPDAWIDFKCGECHTLMRLHVGGDWEELPPVER